MANKDSPSARSWLAVPFTGMGSQGRSGFGGVGGHDQESCFGLVNFEMLVKCPRRDAKWPVG